MTLRAGICGLAFVMAVGSPPAEAGFIGNACMKANRPAASRALCTCIDKVAKKEMTRSQRKKAAKFFSDPHKAQEVRQSDRKSDENLWKNYKAFSAKASKTCS
ncbi:MAG: hypothetical protein AB3N23_03950 [Paracoccaceae bacterium]